MDQEVSGGVDSHTDTIHVAVISDNGGHLADAEFATTAAGYAAALAFLTAHGQVTAIGVEGTSSYGAGFIRTARSHEHQVIEVNRPDRAERRRTGKSDPIDAYAAGRAALSGRASSAPKDDTVTAIRALHNTARPAIKARTAALNQIGNVLVTAPDTIRAKYGTSRAPSARKPSPGISRPATPSTSRSSPHRRASPAASRNSPPNTRRSPGPWTPRPPHRTPACGRPTVSDPTPPPNC